MPTDERILGFSNCWYGPAISSAQSDVISVIDGRPEIVEEVRHASPDVRSYIASEIGRLLSTRTFVDALPGFLLPDSASQARYPLLHERLRVIAQADT